MWLWWFFWVVRLTSADGGRSGVRAAGCSVRWPAAPRCLWPIFSALLAGLAGLRACWTTPSFCQSGSSLTVKTSLDKVDKANSAAAHCVHGLLWTKEIIWSISDRFIHTQADTHPAAAMCEACFTSLSHPRVKVAACSLSIFSVKTWERWTVSCLHQWAHSAWVLTKWYELLSTESNAQLDLTQ